MYASALCWMRRDLRLSDHRALAEATARADRVAVVFVYDRVILDALADRDDRRVTFIHRSLAEVDAGLRQAGSRLLTLKGDPVEEIPRLARELGAQAVFTNRDAEPYALQRDGAVADRLDQAGISFETFKDHVVFEGHEVQSQGGVPFRVFTPYMRAWRARLQPSDLAECGVDVNRFWPVGHLPNGRSHTLEEVGFAPSELWLEPGQEAASARLARFLEGVEHYGSQRDFPALDGTSGLSVHLRFGTISIRECFRAVAADPRPGAQKWMDELIWREFYQMILSQFPHVVDHAFRPEFDGIEWPGEPEHLRAWEAGQTGYPLVDAAMRCLVATGWMHNRLRMVCASFLVKDLLNDWRLGERFFARYLLDFDLAQNNGGWQWAASTGVDAQPHFRIFNPVLQSKKFDPGGAFIRRWCPELAGLSDEHVHWPHDGALMEQLVAGCEMGRDYPHPIVDHARQRERALRLLGEARLAATT